MEQKKQEQVSVYILPVFDRIFIERDPEIKVKDGIAIPQTAREKATMGTIKLVGESCVKAKPGDRVLFGRGAGMDLSIGSQVFTMLRESEIYAFHNIPPAETGEEYKAFKYGDIAKN
jgi:co-chaperonin GroES (HSP10)